MKPIDPIVIPLEGHVVMHVDIATMVGNLINLYIAGNKRGAWHVRLEPSVILEALRLARGSTDAWINKIDVSKQKQLDVRSRFDEVAGPVKEIIMSLFRRPRQTSDYGALVSDALADADGMWSVTYGSTPSSGYARPMLSVLPQTGLAAMSGTKKQAVYTRLPGPCSDWNLAIAFMCAVADLTRWSEALIPNTEGLRVAGHTAKDQPWGALFAFEDQVKTIWSMLALYLTQGSALIAHANRRLDDFATQTRVILDPRAKPALEARAQGVEIVRGVRLHPLVSMIARALATGTINTFHGKKDILYAHGLLTPDAGGTDISEVIIEDAMSEFGRTTTDRWGDCSVMNTDAEGKAANDPISMGVLARQILSLGEYHERWNAVINVLGWTDIPANVGELNHVAADFILCDGTRYGREPVAGLLGLSPVLSVANQRVGGLSLRYEPNFCIEGCPAVTTMVVDGYQAATGDEAVFERLYIPAGMWMGEEQYTSLQETGSDDDPMVARVVKHFKGKANLFVDQYYRDPATTDVTGAAIEHFHVTDWDSYGEDTVPGGAQLALTTGYKEFTVAADKTRLLESKTRFYHRFLVRRSRPSDELLFFNTQGKFQFNIQPAGHVIFDHELSIAHSSVELEKLVSSASMAPAGTTAPLPNPTDQVET